MFLTGLLVSQAAAVSTSTAWGDQNVVDRIIVEGQTDEVPRLESRFPTTSIDLSELRARALDTADVIERARGVNVRQQGGIGARQTVSLDGLSGRRVRIFIDGVPAEVAGLGYAPAVLPISLLDRVDIYRGVVPVQLGADALGGAIDYVTRADEPDRYAEATYRVGAFQSHQGTANAGITFGATGWSLAADGFVDGSANDYEIRFEQGTLQGDSVEVEVPQFNDGFLGYGAGLDLKYEPNSDVLLSLRGYFTGFDDDVQHGFILSPPLAGEATSGEDSAGALLRLRAERLSPWLGVDGWVAFSRREITFRDVSTNVYDENGNIIRTDSLPGELDVAVDQRVQDSELIGRVNLKADLSSNHSIVLGLTPNYVRREGQIELTEDPSELAELVGGLEWAGSFWADRIRTSLFSKLYVQSASSFSVLGEIAQEVQRTSVDPGAGAVVEVGIIESLSANVSYEWATRLPDVDEIFGDGILVRANPELQPERSHNWNLFLQAEDLRLAGVRIDAELGGFVRDATDLIFLEVGDLFSVNRNVGGARFIGASSSLAASLLDSHLDLFATLTYESGQNTAEGGDFERRRGDQLPNRPIWYGTFVVTGRIFDLLSRQDLLEIYWNARWIEEYFLFWESDGREDTKATIPSQFLQDIGITYDIESLFGSNTRLAFNAELRNFTDEDAFDFFRVPRPGRAFFLKLSANF